MACTWPIVPLAFSGWNKGLHPGKCWQESDVRVCRCSKGSRKAWTISKWNSPCRYQHFSGYKSADILPFSSHSQGWSVSRAWQGKCAEGRSCRVEFSLAFDCPSRKPYPLFVKCSYRIPTPITNAKHDVLSEWTLTQSTLKSPTAQLPGWLSGGIVPCWSDQGLLYRKPIHPNRDRTDDWFGPPSQVCPCRKSHSILCKYRMIHLEMLQFDQPLICLRL